MIRYNAATRVLVMDLTDLEHCGFDWDEFDSELFTSGIDDVKEAAWPVALVVNFAGGYVLNGEVPPTDVRLAQRRADAESFRALLSKLGVVRIA